MLFILLLVQKDGRWIKWSSSVKGNSFVHVSPCRHSYIQIYVSRNIFSSSAGVSVHIYLHIQMCVCVCVCLRYVHWLDRGMPYDRPNLCSSAKVIYINYSFSSGQPFYLSKLYCIRADIYLYLYFIYNTSDFYLSVSSDKQQQPPPQNYMLYIYIYIYIIGTCV